MWITLVNRPPVWNKRLKWNCACMYKCIVLCTLREKTHQQTKHLLWVHCEWVSVCVVWMIIWYRPNVNVSIRLFNSRNFMSGIFVKLYVLLYIHIKNFLYCDISFSKNVLGTQINNSKIQTQQHTHQKVWKDDQSAMHSELL